MNGKERTLFFFGTISSAMGFMFTGIFLVYIIDTDYSQPGENIATDFALWAVIGVVPLLFGITLCYLAIKSKKKRQADLLENQILQLAGDLHGKMTIAELAQHTRLSLKEAEELLEGYAKTGIAERHISDGGVFVYYFIHVISREEKEGSKPLF